MMIKIVNGKKRGNSKRTRFYNRIFCCFS